MYFVCVWKITSFFCTKWIKHKLAFIQSNWSYGKSGCKLKRRVVSHQDGPSLGVSPVYNSPPPPSPPSPFIPPPPPPHIAQGQSSGFAFEFLMRDTDSSSLKLALYCYQDVCYFTKLIFPRHCCYQGCVFWMPCYWALFVRYRCCALKLEPLSHDV